ncbi:MAG: cell division protein ZipA C-terminal FtsZ-binding domain-containing protein [Candidatus Competibacter denitrificans]
MDKTQLQWLLAVVGAAVVVLIYLWGIRSRLKEEIRNRRRRPSQANEPKWGDAPPDLPEDDGTEVHEFGDLGRVTPDHHLADKILVDVEIHPVNRELDPEQAPPPTKSPLEKLLKPPVPHHPPTTEFEPTPSALQRSSTEKSSAAVQPPASQKSTSTAKNPPMDLGLNQPLPEADPNPVPSPEAKAMVALTVMASRHQTFKGADIQAAAEEAGLQLAASGLFERYPTKESGADNPVFSLAHLRKPGSFEAQTLAQLSTPGLLIFMSLPGPLDGTKALDLLVLAADRVARKLNGVICDEQGHRMTNQGLLALRDKVAKLGGTAR